MKKQERKKWLGLVALSMAEYRKLGESADWNDSWYILCSYCKYNSGWDDELECEFPVESISEILVDCVLFGDDCWGFRPRRGYKFVDMAKEFMVTAAEAELAYESEQVRIASMKQGKIIEEART